MFDKKKIISIEEVYFFSPPPDLTSAHWEHTERKNDFLHIQKLYAQNHSFIIQATLTYFTIILVAALMGKVTIPKLSAIVSPPFITAIGYHFFTTKKLLSSITPLFQRGVFVEKTFPEVGSFFQQNEALLIHKKIIRHFTFGVGVTHSALSISLVIAIFFLTKNLGVSVAIAFASLAGLGLSLIAFIGYKSLEKIQLKTVTNNQEI